VFTRGSRYLAVPDLILTAADGSTVTVKDVRPPPNVTGAHRHTVTAGDRLDLLAATYYGNPLRYWRICDANLDVLSPLALLGDEPVTTVRIPVTPDPHDPEPEPATLIRALYDLLGVENAALEDDLLIVPDPHDPSGTTQAHRRAARVTYNRLEVDVATLIDTVGANRFLPGPVTELGRLGEQIVIPPAVAG